MRSGDRPTPTINPDPDVIPYFLGDLHIGIERQPIASYVWDDGTALWDDPQRDYEWDDRQGFPWQRFELWCKCFGLTITSGGVDNDGLFASNFVEMTLDNRDGSLSQYDETGRLIDWQPGSPLDIWATFDDEDYWLFSGRITRWEELVDGLLDVEAFDAFSELNRFLGRWTPGFVNQNVAARLTSICNRAGYLGPTAFEPGDVTLLTAEVDDRTALEMMQATVLSDGGALYCDADGTIVYDPRNWIYGRADQGTRPVISWNHCEGTQPVWDPVLLTSDEPIVNEAHLANIAEPPLEVVAVNGASMTRHGPQGMPSPRTDDLWQTAPQGQALADWIVEHRGNHYLRLEKASFYLHDLRHSGLWPMAIDLRLGDLVDFVHHQPRVDGVELMALTLTVSGVIHDIRPGEWVTTFETTRAVGHRDFVIWDETTFTWDQADTGNIYAI